MKTVSEELLFSLNIPKKLGLDNFNLHEAYVCLQLCQLSYLTIDTQRKILKKYKFNKFKTFSVLNTYAFICIKNKTLFITFKGSDFTDPSDIVDNLKIEKVKEGKGKVHLGYKEHIDRIWLDLLKEISKIKFDNIIITGHSMGGAVGQIANYRLPGTKGYYFGSARSVNSTIYKNQKSFVYHIQNEYDLITNFPPKLFFGFRLIGTRFVLKYGKLYLRPQSLFEIFYGIFYMLAFLFLLGISKIFGIKNKMKDLLLKNHEIIYYHRNLEAYIVEESFSILRNEKKTKNIIKNM